MDKKKVNDLIKQARIDSGLKQKDARKGVMSGPAYSKLENGNKTVNINELLGILDNLSISLTEFSRIYLQPDLTETTRHKFKTLHRGLPSDRSKKEILSLYNELEHKYPELTTEELGVYFDIKTLFHKDYPALILPVTRKELRNVITRTRNTSKLKFFGENYRLISQTIMNMEPQEMEEIIDIIFPIDNLNEIEEPNKSYICNIFINVVTPMLMKKEYSIADRMLKIAETHHQLYDDSYYFKLNLKYLKNMLNYLITHEMSYFEKVIDVINAFEILEDFEIVRALKDEVNWLLADNSSVELSKYNVIIARK